MIEDLIETLEREFYSFDVLQLVAVIEELLEDGGEGRIFFEADAGLAFPPSDVGYAGVDPGLGVTVRLPVMNLLGSSSPLPIGFSDHITRGRPDADMYADFLSIMQNRLHALWLDARRKNSLWGLSAPLGRQSRSPVAEKIFKFMTGLSIDKEGFFKFALSGFWPLANRARSAQGLKELLFAAWGGIPINIEENAGRWAAVSNARPIGGGARLGKNAALGTRIYDRTSKFRITVGPLDFQTYETFMPGGSNYRLVDEILAVYLNEPVICGFSVTCALRDLPRTRLGGGGALGRTAALGTGGGRGAGTAVYKKK
jgi:type VI secretion system protein ImpH